MGCSFETLPRKYLDVPSGNPKVEEFWAPVLETLKCCIGG